MKAVLVFLAMLLTDYLYAKWTVSVATQHAAGAFWYGALIIACSALTIVEYTKNPWLVIPAALGAGVGGWIAVRIATMH